MLTGNVFKLCAALGNAPLGSKPIQSKGYLAPTLAMTSIHSATTPASTGRSPMLDVVVADKATTNMSANTGTETKRAVEDKNAPTIHRAAAITEMSNPIPFSSPK